MLRSRSCPSTLLLPRRPLNVFSFNLVCRCPWNPAGRRCRIDQLIAPVQPIAPLHSVRPLWNAWLGGLVLLVVFFSGCGSDRQPFDLSAARYVGRDQCINCHAEQASLHAGSHHDLAMQPATDASVLGDFNNAILEWQGLANRMFRDGPRYMVETEGPTGDMEAFEVKYVFGVEPLQQYMVEFPGAEQADSGSSYPRIQVLPVCWNTLEKKWFFLMPPDVPSRVAPSDDLHWTGIAQRWNTMCADCHSTRFAKNFETPTHPVAKSVAYREEVPTDYNSQINGEYHSSFSEIDVSCEACHGPGSVHVELAKQYFPGWNRQRGYGLANLKATAENEIQVCAPCHSRRSIVAPGFDAGDNYYDHYTNALLTEPTYYADGQVWDEDYVHGSFIQSKMYHKGIRCSDCHDPHTARLKHEGNAVCTSCHQHPAAKYDSVAHHFHKTEGDPTKNGTQCVDCHMPATTYMQCDSRRDHSLRIPRPDLSVAIGVPNACTGCHLKAENIAEEDRGRVVLYQDWMQAAREGNELVQQEIDRANRWADAACDKWYGAQRRRDEHFGLALAAAQRREPDAAERLVELLGRRGETGPALARATALELLLRVDPAVAGREAIEAMGDEHPLVRRQAAATLVAAAGNSRAIELLREALSDPVRSVRTQAVRSLLQIDPRGVAEDSGNAMRAALKELQTTLENSGDHAGAHVDLGLIAEQQGKYQQAISHYETAVAVEPGFVGPRSNLAALLERLSRTAATGTAGDLESRVKGLRKTELPLIERDAGLLPNSAELQYRFALALYLDGQLERASQQAVRASELDSNVVEYAQMASLLFQSLGKRDEAIRWAESAVERSGNAPDSRALLESVRGMKL